MGRRIILQLYLAHLAEGLVDDTQSIVDQLFPIYILRELVTMVVLKIASGLCSLFNSLSLAMCHVFSVVARIGSSFGPK